MENKNEFKKIGIINSRCYYSDDITRVEDTDFDKILSNKKSNESILIYNISYKTLWFKNHYVLSSMRYMELLKFLMELDIYNYLVLGFIIEFMIGSITS